MENQYKIRSPFFYAVMRLISNRAALVSGVLLFLIVLMAIFAPLITVTSYEEQKFLMNSLAFPSQTHWFGIDDLGRDLFSRIIYGARVSLTIGFAAAVCSVFIGLPFTKSDVFYGSA